MTNRYLKQVASEALTAKAQGKRDTSLFLFGVALHTMQDSVSPSHRGFQPWSDNEGPVDVGLHVVKEIINPGSKSDLRKITKKAWEAYKSGDLSAFSVERPCI